MSSSVQQRRIQIKDRICQSSIMLAAAEAAAAAFLDLDARASFTRVPAEVAAAAAAEATEAVRAAELPMESSAELMTALDRKSLQSRCKLASRASSVVADDTGNPSRAAAADVVCEG